ncbi:MAG: cupin domain-containing protein [Chloroflexota bacterium]|nr:cupin domain-containing protein [Chloroflexota bacterium]
MSDQIQSTVPKLIDLGQGADKYTRLLGGKPETHGMRSGYMVLPPGDEVGLHSTKDAEELILVLEGQGYCQLPETAIRVQKEQAVYIPPHTEHNIRNSGDVSLCYVYVVCPVSASQA